MRNQVVQYGLSDTTRKDHMRRCTHANRIRLHCVSRGSNAHLHHHTHVFVRCLVSMIHSGFRSAFATKSIYIHSGFQSFSLDQVLYLFSSSDTDAHSACLAQENDPRHVTHSHIISSWWRGVGRAQSFGDRCSILFVWCPYLSRQLQDKPSCLESKGGDVDLLLDE